MTWKLPVLLSVITLLVINVVLTKRGTPLLPIVEMNLRQSVEKERVTNSGILLLAKIPSPILPARRKSVCSIAYFSVSLSSSTQAYANCYQEPSVCDYNRGGSLAKYCLEQDPQSYQHESNYILHVNFSGFVGFWSFTKCLTHYEK